jgi:hypothetical protein
VPLGFGIEAFDFFQENLHSVEVLDIDPFNRINFGSLIPTNPRLRIELNMAYLIKKPLPRVEKIPNSI